MDFVLLGFWCFLSTGFLAMAILSLQFKKTLSQQLERAALAAAFQGPDVKELRPIFNRLLRAETIAFILTAIAALVTAISSA